MAASTSSAVDSNNCFDVFINHRGPDVKKTFTSHLYRSLVRNGLRVFIDNREMQEGEDLNHQIQGAIKTASVHVAIFSPTYADSKWCLEELVLMLESEAPIIPVFHNVKPADLRRTQGEGVYARSLHNLEKKRPHESQPRYTSDTIEKWRNALSRVADISGLELEKFDSDEGELVDKVVEVVLKKDINTQLDVARHPTGLDEMVEDFETKVSLHQHSGTVQIVGITGLGGAGKTTLAKELFNRNRSKYSKSCFLFDVRENAKISLPSLQRTLLKCLSPSEQPIDSKDVGIEMLKKHFRVLSSPVLLVLDDVDHQDQVYALLPVTDKPLPPNSLILITSRDKDVLSRSGVQKPSIYQLTGLNTERSRELFCSHAFCQPHPLPGFEDLVDNFLKACNGLPLSLKVFGALLYGNNDISYWKDELEELRKTLHEEIQKRLQISYDALKPEEKEIFLDIACFFIGENRDTAIRVWDGSGWKGLRGFQSLQNKCLVEVEVAFKRLGGKTGNLIRMHDHLRDMGRELAKHPGRQFRFWDGTKNIDDLSQQSSETTPVRGIRMLRPVWYQTGYASYDDDERASFSRYKMDNLRLLDVGIGIKEDLLKCLLEGVGSRSLFWFRWRNCPCSSLPPILMKKLGALRVLEVNGDELETLWPEELQAPLQLRELRISGSLSEIPKSIEQLKYLEHIECRNLKRLPDSFGNLIQLKYLDLAGCNSLSSLPDSFGNLIQLKYLDLTLCIGLSSLPDSFGNLIQLKYLDLTKCQRLSSLPDSFGNLSTLEHIDLTSCSGLKRLPDSFENLIQLKYLDLSGCYNLTAFTGTFGRMSMLEYILLPNCHFEVSPSQIACRWPQEKLNLWLMNLKEWPGASGLEKLVLETPLFLETLPPSLGRDLRNLKSLELRSGQSLKRLPDSFLLLNQLIDLIVKDCSLRELHFKAIEGDSETLTDTEVQRTSSNLEGCLLRLQHLALHNIQISEVSFPTGVCPNLQHLDIRECKDLVEVGALPNALVKLQLYGCSKLRKIDASFPKGVYPNLQHLDIGDCQDLVEVGTFSTALVKLQMIGCPKLRKIGQLCGFAKLQTLDVSRRKEVEELQSIEGKSETLTQSRGQRALSNLELYNTEISEVSFRTGVCPNLQYLSIKHGHSLVEFRTSLKLRYCHKLRKIELCGLAKLQILDVAWCRGVEELSGMETLVSLEKLDVFWCPKLKSIPGLAQLTNLRELNIFSCYDLEELPSVEHLKSLEKMLVRFCVKLKTIRGLEQLTQLGELNVSYCCELEELPGVEHLRSLVVLRACNCMKLKGIRGSAQMTLLEELDVSDCFELEELTGVEHLKSLIRLQARRCNKLKSIQGLAQLTRLRELDVSDCFELEELTGVEHLKSLIRLQARRCNKLKSIQGLAQLTRLRELDVSDCFELEELTGVEHLKSLVRLQARRCNKLKSIQGLAQLTGLRELDVSGFED